MTLSNYFTFDYFNQNEIPAFTLTNPNREPLYTLGGISDRQLKYRYNALSDLTFTAKAKYRKDNVEYDNEYFPFLEYKRLISVENLGYFMITSVEEDNDGLVNTKAVTAQSIDVDFNYKKVSLLKGTYKFYDPINPSGTLLQLLLSYAPDWTINYADPQICALWRTFDISDSTIYNLLMNDVSQAFQCVFNFDILNKTISAYSLTNATTQSDIFLSYDNLLQTSKLSVVADEMITALNVFGAGDLGIRVVNPLGTDTIYNFSYYKTLDWMSQDLIDAITLWENKVISNQTTYANTLSSLLIANATLLTQESDLVTLQGDLAALVDVQKTKIQQHLSITSINSQIKSKKTQITNKQNDITASQATVNGINAQLTAINVDLSFGTNFTTLQQTQLSNFIIGSTYTNENFVQTDIMTVVDIQNMSQDLYNQAEDVLTKISQPRLQFTIDAISFPLLKEYQTFINQLALGTTLTVEYRKDTYAYPVLLEMDINYDDPTQFGMIFGNRLRLDTSPFQLSDLLNQSVNTGITASFNSQQWKDWTNNYKDSVSTFITSALDASKNAVINASNQEITITSAGLRGQYLDPNTNLYDPVQIWMTNNLIAFTDDTWDTAKIALGNWTVNGQTFSGLIADTIVGRLVAANSLQITNTNNTFTLDGNGATLTNATFTLQTSNLNNNILLDPVNGIKIQKRNLTTGSMADQFYVDGDGNVVFAGKLQAAGGTFYGTIYAEIGKIGRWTIDSNGLKDTSGNYIYGNGNTRLGALTINGNQASFAGNIYANNLQGLLQANQIGSVNAGTITTGTMLADRIFGGTIRWGGNYTNPDVQMSESFTGIAEIRARNRIDLTTASSLSLIEIMDSRITIGNLNEVVIGGNYPGIGKTSLNGKIYTDGQLGYTGTLLI